MKQKAISRITITELCQEADLNRATFYAHYTDQFDLLKQIEQELVDDINKYLANYSFREKDTTSFQQMEQILEYIKKNQDVCSVLLSENGDKNFQKEVLAIVKQQCINEWTDKKVNKDVAEYIYDYATSGSLGIIMKWLQEGMERSTAEMAEIIIKLTDRGISAFVSQVYNKRKPMQ